MIAYIVGEIVSMEDNKVILDHGGMGFTINAPTSVMNGVVGIGEEVKLFTYLYVKEDAMQLYGFLSQDDLEIFKLLIGVSGIGPKGALGILSGLTADELRFAVLSDDATTIAKAPGIGKKTAQKLILELKDKLDLQDAFDIKSQHMSSTAVQGAQDAHSEAVQALVVLGYSNADSLRAVRKASLESDDVETVLKEALKYI